MKANWDFLEELKCLFLRARNPNKNIFEDLVQQIFNCDLNSGKGINWLHAANRNFSDFRNKFLDSVDELIDAFKEQRVRYRSFIYFIYFKYIGYFTNLFILFIKKIYIQFEF